jgi:hypothetical protein
MLFSLLNGVDFLVNFLRKGGKNHHGAVHYPWSLQKAATFKFWYKHRYPPNLGIKCVEVKKACRDQNGPGCHCNFSCKGFVQAFILRGVNTPRENALKCMFLGIFSNYLQSCKKLLHCMENRKVTSLNIRIILLSKTFCRWQHCVVASFSYF